MVTAAQTSAASVMADRVRAPWVAGLVVTAQWTGPLSQTLFPGSPGLVPVLILVPALGVILFRVFPVFTGPPRHRWLDAPSLWFNAIVKGLFGDRRGASIAAVAGFVVSVAFSLAGPRA